MAEKSDLETRLDNVHVSNVANCENKGKLKDMFLRIIKKDCVNIKSQQRNETDLTVEEKTGILKALYQRNPCSFLTRFGSCLSEEDFECFSGNIPGSYDVNYTIKMLKRSLVERSSGMEVKNRRYEALQRLEKDSSYFSEYEMRQRCPLLYERYIGQYMTDEEKLERDEKQMSGEVTMSSFIFQQIDREWLEKRQEMEQEREDECMEEEDEEEEEEDEEEEEEDEEEEEIEDKEEEEDGEGTENAEELENIPSEIPNLSDEEKVHLRLEFLYLMRQHFLDGQDKEFDYSKVDTNEEFDNLKILGQDKEDKYFDEEEPETFNNGDNKQEIMLTESEDNDDYLSDKILQKCCKVTR